MKRFCHKQRWIALLTALLMLIGSAAAETYSTLEYGDRGEEVLRLQLALEELGYDPDGTDGKFGRSTEYALMVYQSANGLKPDGKAGHQTLSKMYDGKSIAADGSLKSVTSIGTAGGSQSGSTSSGSVSSDHTTGNSAGSGSGDAALDSLIANAGTSRNPNTIKYGDYGSRVTELQTLLTGLGYSVGGIDGSFGTGTLRALVQFQKDHNLSPDGLCGTKTMALIREKASQNTTDKPTAPDTGDNTGDTGNNSGSTGSSTGNTTGGNGTVDTGSASSKTLQYGDSGSRVTELQSMLIRLGYDPAGADGKFGTGTLRALVQFQKDNKLSPDGLCGTKTMAVLKQKIAALDSGTNSGSSSGNTGASGSGSTGSTGSAGTTANGVPTGLNRTLRSGYSGQDVLTVQRRLKELGYYTGTLDGVYGKGSISAVQAFQRNNKLTADGLAGKSTFKALFSANAISASGKPLGGTTGESTGNTGSTGSSTGSTLTTLGYGSKGDGVRKLQKALKDLNYSITVDGDFGKATKTAVSQFQKCNGLAESGAADPTTLALLYSGKAKPYDASLIQGNTGSGNTSDSTGSSYTALSQGSKGDGVRKLQKALKDLNYSVTVDGDFGAGTKTAVTHFQKCNGLVETGTADPTTQMLLYSGKAKPYDASLIQGSTGSNTGSGSASGSTGSGSSDTVGNTGYTTLSYGAKGDSVRQLQKALKNLKYSVSSDGDYGALTKMAVIAFQKCNGLSPTGTADPTTQALLYSGKGKPYDPVTSGDASALPDGAGQASGPSASSVKLLHWFNDIKPTIRSGQTITVFDPATNLQWTIRFYSLGRHADSEPLTALDTQIMYKAFGYKNTWTPKPVYVKLPSGTWTLATMHNVPHLSGSIKDNDFDGHLCIHFLRDMEECSKNDPNYGVQNQKALRKKWQEMTGQVVD